MADIKRDRPMMYQQQEANFASYQPHPWTQSPLSDLPPLRLDAYDDIGPPPTLTRQAAEVGWIAPRDGSVWCLCAPAKLIQVRKEGSKLYGQNAYVCAEKTCEFFLAADDKDNRRCSCRLPCAKFQVKKAGQNYGRSFYKCAANKCGAFIWEKKL